MKKGTLTFLVGAALSVLGLGAWILQIMKGLSITNLSNIFSWGLYMGSFEFFIGLSSGGMILFAVAYLWNLDDMKKFAKTGAVLSFASVVASGVAILTDLGQPFRVLYMLLSPNFGSPLFWDVAILGIYAVITLLAVIFTILPDTKSHKGNRGYLMAMEDRCKKLSYIALPYIVVLNAGTALMFATQKSKEWWHSAILPVDAVSVGVSSGIALVLLVAALAVKQEDYDSWERPFTILARIAAVALLAHFVFTFLEIVTISWNGSLEGAELLHIVFHKYGLLFALEILLPLIAMIVYFIWNGSSRPLLACMSTLVIIGMFIQKMMHLLPAFNHISLSLPNEGAENALWSFPISSGIFTPGQDLFVRSWDYMPTMPEIATGLLPVGLILLVLGGVWLLFGLIPGEEEEKVKA
ncbi:MAG: polysulfide reductase NrfD [Eubacterium sp.]|nr:polysulfide reductase NrfD [Eubacterium sp.]